MLHHEGVEPTNNRAERAWRCAVQWRKIIFHLTGAIRAHRRRQAVASLLPLGQRCRNEIVSHNFIISLHNGHRLVARDRRRPELADGNAPDAQLARIAASAILAPAERASVGGRSSLDALMARLTELRGDLESGDALDAIFDEAACWLDQLMKGRTS